jgi:DNA-binding transcriptional regulator YdaS (Cro superfamily)
MREMTFPDMLRAAGIKGGVVAAQLGITHGAISQWDKVPVERVLDVERVTGIPRHELRPDIYPPERERDGAAA